MSIFSPFLKKIIVLFKSWLVDLESATLREQFQLMILVMIPAILISGFVYAGHSETETFSTQNGNWTIASNLAKGYGYVACEKAYFPFCGPSNNSTAMREPIPVFLMAFARIINPSHDAGLVMQILLYLGTIPIIFLLLIQERVLLAIIAVLLWIFSIPVIDEIRNDAGHLTAILFYMSGMFFFLHGSREEKNSSFFIAGILMGLASLSRTILMGTAIGLGVVLMGEGILKRRAGKVWNAVLFLGIIVLMLTPWVVRNKVTLGSPVIGSTLTGYNIYRMNYYLGEEPFHPHYVGGEEGFTAITELIKNSDLTGLENEAQMQDFYSRAGKDIILKYPLRYIELSLYRFGMLWFDISVKEAYGEKMYLKDYGTLFGQGILLILGIFGAIKRFKDYWPLIVTVILGSGAYMAVNAQLRYLVDLMPSIIVLAALSLPHIHVSQVFNKKDSNTLLNR